MSDREDSPEDEDLCKEEASDENVEAGERDKKCLDSEFELDDEKLRSLLQSATRRSVRSVQVEGFHHVEFLASGGQADVFRARRPDGAFVVLKVLSLSNAPVGRGRRRFRKLKKLSNQLDHPSIAPILEETRTHDGRPCVVMHWYTGGSFGDGRPMGLGKHVTPDLREFSKQAYQVASALAHAHAIGILHRDLKPANILLTESRDAVLTDFGLAAQMDADGRQSSASLDASRVVLGDFKYLAPEQLTLAQLPSKSSDLYALGAVLYHLLTGRIPHVIGDHFGNLGEIKQKLPPRPSQVLARRKGLSAQDRRTLRSWDAVLFRLMQPVSADRYASAEELCRDIERLAAGSRVKSPGMSLSARSLRWARSSPLLAGGLALIAVAAPALIVREWDRHRLESAVTKLIRQLEQTPIFASEQTDPTLALASSESRITLLEAINKIRPKDLDLRLALARAWRAHGELTRQQLSHTEALDPFRRSLELFQTIDVTRHDPRVRGEYSRAHVYVGDSLKEVDHFDREALACYLTALELDLANVEQFPTLSFGWDDLFWSYLRLSSLSRRKGEELNARSYLLEAQRAIEMSEEVGASPSAVLRMRQALLLEESSLEHALDEFETWLEVQLVALRHATRAHQLNAKDNQVKVELAFAHARVARAHAALREHHQSSLHLAQCQEFARQVIQEAPRQLLVKRLLVESQLMPTNSRAGDRSQLPYCQVAHHRDELTALVQVAPHNVEVLRDLSCVLEMSADYHFQRGEYALAMNDQWNALRIIGNVKALDGRAEQALERLAFYQSVADAIRN